MNKTKRRYSLFRTVPLIVCALFLLLSGCMGMTIKDDLPLSSPKGYADFANHSYGRAFVYSIQKGKKVKEGSLTYTGKVLRIARPPGSHEFLVEHWDSSNQKYEKTVTVEIVPDRLSFITIDRHIVEVTDILRERSEETLITYKVKIILGKTPVPLHLEREQNKNDILSSLLNDPDWRARLYAIAYLEKAETSYDKAITEKLSALAVDDGHREVRKQAAALLAKLGFDAFRNILFLENFELNKRTWINSSRNYDFFYNDEFLFGAEEGGCEDQFMKSPLYLPRNFDLELVSTWKSGSSSDAYGVLIGRDESNFDTFGISSSGQAIVRATRDAESAPELLAWTNVPAMNLNGAAPNRVRVEARGDTWNYYVNDAFVGTVASTLNTSSYSIGLRVCGKQMVVFDQLKIRSVSDK